MINGKVEREQTKKYVTKWTIYDTINTIIINCKIKYAKKNNRNWVNVCEIRNNVVGKFEEEGYTIHRTYGFDFSWYTIKW